MAASNYGESFWELDSVPFIGGKRRVEQTNNAKVLIPMQQLLDVFTSHGYDVTLEKKVDYIQFFSATRK